MSGISIQAFNNLQPYNVQFRGNCTSDSNTPYRKSNTGLLGGLVLSVPAALDFLPDLKMKDNAQLEKQVSDYAKDLTKDRQDLENMLKDNRVPDFYKNFMKKINNSKLEPDAYRNLCKKRTKIAIPATLIAMGSTIGCGAIIDAARNKKAAKTANQIASAKNAQEIINNPNIEITDEGIPYHKSKTGKRLAPIFGALCGGLSAYLNNGYATKPMNMTGRAAAFGLCGLAAGTIYDGIVDKQEKKSINYLA